MKQFLSTTMTFATLLGFGLVANFAAAENSDAARFRFDQKSVRIEFYDLNPATPADAKELLDRFQRGASNACERNNDDMKHLFLKREREACMAEGYAHAVATVNRKLGIDVEAIAATYQPGSLASAPR